MSVPINHFVEDERELLVISITGSISGREFSSFACNMYGNRPEFFKYTCILDLLFYRGDVLYSDLGELQKLYNRHAADPSAFRLGAIVTTDPYFQYWAVALDEQFPGRKHFIATTLEGAFELIERVGD